MIGMIGKFIKALIVNNRDSFDTNYSFYVFFVLYVILIKPYQKINKTFKKRKQSHRCLNLTYEHHRMYFCVNDLEILFDK